MNSPIYELLELTPDEGGLNARVRVNPAHEIFAGHFPGQPVMPGVCMMEMLADIASKKTELPLRISGGPVIKFLNMVDPRKTPEIQAEMRLNETSGEWSATGRLFNESLVFVRFQLTLTAIPQ